MLSGFRGKGNTMRRITSITLAAGLLLGASASAQLRVIKQLERSYELALTDVTLPSSTAGTLIFKACEDCASESLQVTAETRYFLRESELSFEDFLLQADAILAFDEEAADAGLGVHYSIETGFVTRMHIVRPRPYAVSVSE